MVCVWKLLLLLWIPRDVIFSLLLLLIGQKPLLSPGEVFSVQIHWSTQPPPLFFLNTSGKTRKSQHIPICGKGILYLYSHLPYAFSNPKTMGQILSRAHGEPKQRQEAQWVNGGRCTAYPLLLCSSGIWIIWIIIWVICSPTRTVPGWTKENIFSGHRKISWCRYWPFPCKCRGAGGQLGKVGAAYQPEGAKLDGEDHCLSSKCLSAPPEQPHEAVSCKQSCWLGAGPFPSPAFSRLRK